MVYNVTWSFFFHVHFYKQAAVIVLLYMQTLRDISEEAWMQTRGPVEAKYFLHSCKMRHVRVTLGPRYIYIYICVSVLCMQIKIFLKPVSANYCVCVDDDDHWEYSAGSVHLFIRPVLCSYCVTAYATERRHCLDGCAIDVTVYLARTCIIGTDKVDQACICMWRDMGTSDFGGCRVHCEKVHGMVCSLGLTHLRCQHF